MRAWVVVAVMIVGGAVAPAAFDAAIPERATAGPPASASPFFDDLDTYDASRWMKADGWANGAPFAVGWRADHIDHAGVMSLRLDDIPCPQGCSGEPYASGEYRTIGTYGYGRYEVRMRAAAGEGLVTSFFTYNGPFETPPVAWSEIDIEILGKDPTRMQTNYRTGDVGGHETMIDLGFDASADFHTYAIDWSPERIEWYVDGVLVHTEDGSRGPIPAAPAKVMMNLWAGRGVDEWLGPFTYTGPVVAAYDWVRYTPAGEPEPPPQTPSVHVASIDITVVQQGRRYQAVARVALVDGTGAPVAGATIDGTWSGATRKGDGSRTTDAAGIATFYSSRTSSRGPYTFCVTNVASAGSGYDSASNVETCDSASR